MFRPKAIAIDFETALLSGEPSVDYYRNDFRATSAAFAWKSEDGSTKTLFVKSEESIREFLEQCEDIPLICHNFTFEYSVLLYRFPTVKHSLMWDTMRLAQLTDGGGKEEFKTSKTIDDMMNELMDDTVPDHSGFKLDKVARRFLTSEFHEHKAEAHSWLRVNKGIKKGKEGQHLNLLPDDLFERYNVADAVVTLELFYTLDKLLTDTGYNWKFDHQLYRVKCEHIAKAKGEGVRVDREKLQAYKDHLDIQVKSYYDKVRELYPTQIQEIEDRIFQATLDSYKTDKGRENARLEMLETGSYKFKLGSAKMKELLLIDMLGFTTPFKTKTGKPSFKKTHMSNFGEFGKLVQDRGTLMISKKQAESILAMSEYDGKIHLSLRPVSTSTGRNAGGEGKS